MDAERTDWLRRFHRDRRPGLDGPLGEATWAVAVDGRWSVRSGSKRTAEPAVLETGIWLTRGARGQGTGRLAIAAVLAGARARGAEVRADTSRDNAAALYVLQRLGFRTSAAGARVIAVRTLDSGPGNEKSPRSVTWGSTAGGRYWDRTSDLFRVREARYRCANRPSRPDGRTLLRARAPRSRGGDGI